MRLAINLSVHQLRQPDRRARIAAALSAYRLEPRVLTCEVTEVDRDGRFAGDARSDPAARRDRVCTCRSTTSATRLSNLSCLHQAAAEELKIDRSFVLDLEVSGDARAIVDAVVKLARQSA